LTNTGRECRESRPQIGVLIRDLIALADALELSENGLRQFGLEVPISIAAEDAAAGEPMPVNGASFLLLIRAPFAGHLAQTRHVQFGRQIDRLGWRHEEQVIVAHEVAACPAGGTLSHQFAVLLKLRVDPVVEDSYFGDDSAMSF